MLITKVQKSRRERGRYDVFIDEKPSLCVTDAFRARFNLFTGNQIDEATMPTLLAAETLERANLIAMNFLSYRPRSSREIVDKLSHKGFGRDVAGQVVERLKELHLLNDVEFARMFVRDRLRGKPMGTALLRKKLIDKGISFQLSERVVKEYVKPEDEENAAKDLLNQKLKTSRARYSKLDPYLRKKRLMEYLMRRGFSLEVASKSVRTITF